MGHDASGKSLQQVDVDVETIHDFSPTHWVGGKVDRRILSVCAAGPGPASLATAPLAAPKGVRKAVPARHIVEANLYAALLLLLLIFFFLVFLLFALVAILEVAACPLTNAPPKYINNSAQLTLKSTIAHNMSQQDPLAPRNIFPTSGCQSDHAGRGCYLMIRRLLFQEGGIPA